MNGKRAKQMRRLAPLVHTSIIMDAQASLDKGVPVDLTKLPDVKQVYRKMKGKYTGMKK